MNGIGLIRTGNIHFCDLISRSSFRWVCLALSVRKNKGEKRRKKRITYYGFCVTDSCACSPTYRPVRRLHQKSKTYSLWCQTNSNRLYSTPNIYLHEGNKALLLDEQDAVHEMSPDLHSFCNDLRSVYIHSVGAGCQGRRL